MSELIFITGVSGYIGFQTLVLSLEAGFNVRAPCERFVVIPDLTDVDVLAQNLEGVSGVLHLASPLAIETDDYDRDIIEPALAVTSSILTAAKRTPTIKRVVVTSSAVTLVPFSWLFAPDSQPIYTSSSINTSTSGPYSSPMEAYWSSKALSRAFVHDFIAKEAPHFETIQLLPSVVIGLDMLAETPEDVLTGTRALALAPLLGQTIPTPLVGVSVHVLDVAKAHVDSLSASVAGNRDYILSSDTPEGILWNDVLRVGEKYFPRAIEKGILKMGGSMETTTYKIGDGGSFWVKVYFVCGDCEGLDWVVC